jgi:hypothetical protein
MRTEAKQESSAPVCLPLSVARFFKQTAAKHTAHALPFRIISPKQEIYLAAETEGGRIWQKQTW